MATACRDGLVRLWDVAQGTPTGPVFRHGKWVNTVEFSPDGARLLTAADDGVAQVWNVATGAAVGKPLRYASGVKMAAFSNDGLKVVTASEDGTARIWLAATGDPVGSVLAHRARVQVATFSPDGRWVATASADQTARMWDASTGTPASDALRHSGIVRWVEFSPEGQRLATASEDRTVRVWSVATGELLLEPIHHRNTVWTARFSPDGRRLVTAAADGTAQIWDVLPGAIAEMTLSVMSRGKKASWSSDGRRLLTVTRTAGLWHAHTGNGIAPDFPERDVRDARFNPSGNLVAVAGGSGTARVWDGHSTEAVSLPMRHQGAVNSIEFSPDESRVATASEDGTACLWDARRGILSLPPLRHPGAVRRATFSPDGRLLATACADPEARLWDTATGKLLIPTLSHQAEVQDVKFSPDGRRLLTVLTDSTVQVWDVPTRRRCGPPLKHDGPVSQAMFTPDSRQVLTASHDWTVRVWDPDSGKLAAQTLQHEGVVASLDLRADGRTLLTATRSGRLELWHDYREHPLSTSLCIGRDLWHVVFSPDGISAITVGSEHAARVLRFPRLCDSVPDWFPAFAEAIVGRTASSDESLGFVAPEVLLDFRQRINAPAPDSLTRGWAQWWLADKTQRSADPQCGLDLESYVARVIDLVSPAMPDCLSALRRAMCRAPDHGGLLAHYARMLLETGAVSAPAVLQEAEWYCARAIQLSPEDAGVWLARAALSEHAGKTNDATSAMEKVKKFGASSPVFLLAAATFQERAGHPEAADDAYRQAIEVALAREDWADGNRRALMRQRADFLARQGRHAEARAEELRALGVRARNSAAPDRLINLEAFYNESLDASLNRQDCLWLNLSALPKGRQILGETEFDIRGIVQLGSTRRRGTSSRVYPERVEAIPIGQPCRRIHFLHAAEGEVAGGTVVAVYRIHLQDGRALEIPVAYGKDVLAWDDETGPEPTVAHVAWQGRSPGTTRLRLFHTAWELPPPGQQVMRLDFVSRMTASGPFLIAVTVE